MCVVEGGGDWTRGGVRRAASGAGAASGLRGRRPRPRWAAARSPTPICRAGCRPTSMLTGFVSTKILDVVLFLQIRLCYVAISRPITVFLLTVIERLLIATA